jgi:hypothetical protein
VLAEARHRQGKSSLWKRLIGEIIAHTDKIQIINKNGVLPLPKSVTPSRIAENLQVFDFAIAKEDMRVINQMDYFCGSGLHPDQVPF